MFYAQILTQKEKSSVHECTTCRMCVTEVRNSLTSRLFQPDTGRLKSNFRSSNLHLNTMTANKQPTQG